MRLCIDPGMNVGVAMWYDEEDEKLLPDEVCLIKPDYGTNWLDKFESLCEEWSSFMEDISYRVSGVRSKVIIEEVQFFSSQSGRTSADSGNLVKLARVQGFLLSSVLQYFRIEKVILSTVQEWKGGMKKEVFIRRIKNFYRDNGVDLDKELDRLLSVKDYSSSDLPHICDAIGIGLHSMGYEV